MNQTFVFPAFKKLTHLRARHLNKYLCSSVSVICVLNRKRVIKDRSKCVGRERWASPKRLLES